ncbi:MAG: GNAT family N-acetyltransferase [Candidatus Thorarchaeota archaeon]
MSLLQSVEVPTDGIDTESITFFIIRNEKDGKIIGCVGLEYYGAKALLRSFAVDPLYQNRRLGISLVNKLLEEAIESGTDAVYVCTAKVPAFFYNIGFVGVDLDDVPYNIRSSRLFTQGCPRAAAYLKKDLTNPLH